MGSVNTKKTSVNVKKILDTDFSPAKVLGIKKATKSRSRKGKDKTFHFNLDPTKSGLGGRGL